MSSVKLRLVKTCDSCPEQYDVYLEDKEVGYMRLRHGVFTAEYKSKQVYVSHTYGDGSFQDHERSRELNRACAAIIAAMEDRDEEVEDLFTIERKGECDE